MGLPVLLAQLRTRPTTRQRRPIPITANVTTTITDSRTAQARPARLQSTNVMLPNTPSPEAGTRTTRHTAATQTTADMGDTAGTVTTSASSAGCS
jgi:hypothetical protein